MRHWSESRRKALAALGQQLAPLFDEVTPFAHAIGFDSWRFVVLDHQPTDAPLLLKTTLPDPFVNHYIDQRFWSQDPRHQHGITSIAPLRWEPSLFSEAPDLWRLMQDIDVTQGMSQACHHSSGLTALLCFGRTGPQLDESEFATKTDRVLALANRLTVASVERIASDDTIELPDGEPGKRLTRREITVLEKTAEGHTAGYIAAGMYLSERTVQFHISSTITKLGVANKTAAVAKAISLGLIRIH